MRDISCLYIYYGLSIPGTFMLKWYNKGKSGISSIIAPLFVYILYYIFILHINVVGTTSFL